MGGFLPVSRPAPVQCPCWAGVSISTSREDDPMKWDTPLMFAVGWNCGQILKVLVGFPTPYHWDDVIVIMSCIVLSLWLHHRKHGGTNV